MTVGALSRETFMDYTAYQTAIFGKLEKLERRMRSAYHSLALTVEDINLVAADGSITVNCYIGKDKTDAVGKHLNEGIFSVLSKRVIAANIIYHQYTKVILDIPAYYKQLEQHITGNSIVKLLVAAAQRDSEVLPILADCLEELGCTDSLLLTLCREEDDIVLNMLEVKS